MPAYYKSTFKLDKVGDTFLDMSTWGKGMVWVNGHAMGRFWEIGPQQTLFMPGCWLKEGDVYKRPEELESLLTKEN